jgi:5-methylcytosine-specific restriction endonuclease McrA
MSTKGIAAWNKGKKMPHSKEWEENRIAKVRESAKKRIYPKGYTRPEANTKPMVDAIKNIRKENPERFKAISIENLPKDTKNEKNGNWRGGITKETRDYRTQQSSKFSKLRKQVIARDGGICKNCGTSENLEVHHIIPLSDTLEFAFYTKNGVTLCHDCHVKTESYAGRSKRNALLNRGAKTIARIVSIPSKWQDYDTLGNWMVSDGGELAILVSEDHDGVAISEDAQFLCALHELVEVWLCKKRGITQAMVDEFDFQWTEDGEPGDSPDAPYRREHRFAMLVEHLMAQQMCLEGYGVVT